MGSPPGRPVKRARTNFAGPVPECVHINKRITAAQSAEVRLYMTHTWAAYLSILQCDLYFRQPPSSHFCEQIVFLLMMQKNGSAELGCKVVLIRTKESLEPYLNEAVLRTQPECVHALCLLLLHSLSIHEDQVRRSSVL